MKDGIYFDIDFPDYLALERFSSGALTNLMEGPPSFWADSWMNPDREEREESPAMTLGAAYHCARLEPEHFEERYCRDLVPEDLGEDLLCTDTAVKARLQEIGEPQTKAGELAAERAMRLAAIDPDGPPIWHIARLEWETDVQAGRTAIDPVNWDRIHRDTGWLRANPEVAILFQGGFPEVTILWTDDRTGLPCKCRPDYLKPGSLVHLKTWDTKAFGKPANKAIRESFQYNGHYRTGWFYQSGMEAIRTHTDLPIDGSKKQRALVAEIRERAGPLDTFFVFQRRGGVPDVRARRVRYWDKPPGVRQQSIGAEDKLANFADTETALGMKARLEVWSCLDMANECLEIYGTGPWFPRDLVATLDDEDFPGWWLDSMDAPR